MLFYSTKDQSQKVSLKKAVLSSLAKEGGLFMPKTIPVLEVFRWHQFADSSLAEIAYQLMKKYFCPDIVEKDLYSICQEVFDFPCPLKKVGEDTYSLELYHGPTGAFKDFGARFLARVLANTTKNEKKHLTVLVATSGDTGGAVANGFFDVDGINVIILYPSKKVSPLQEKQLTTLGHNIKALEVLGSFDDCQRLVKTAFADTTISQNLVAANSINLARLLPQMAYQVYATAKLIKQYDQIFVSVPSGNFGNLTSGLIAKKMGCPIQKFIAATNINDAFVNYLSSGNFEPKPSKQTISNAMDVGNPNNFPRIIDLFDNNINNLRQSVEGFSFTDQETRECLKEVYSRYDYTLDPHGAVAYLGLQKALKVAQATDKSKIAGVFLETAHPAKFKDIVEEVINSKIEIPENLKSVLDKDKISTKISNNYQEFKNFLRV